VDKQLRPEELVNDERTLLKLWRSAMRQLHNDRYEKHRDGSRQAKQVEAERAQQVKRDSHDARGGDVSDIHVAVISSVAIHVVVLAGFVFGLHPSGVDTSCQDSQKTRKQNRHQAAEHYRR